MYEQDTRVDRVLAAVLASEGQLTERDAAALVFVSLRRLRELFRSRNGVSFRTHCYRVRMETARLQLEEGSTPITAIAWHLGYSSRSELDRSFKRFYGVTPAHHRKTATQAIYKQVSPAVDSPPCLADPTQEVFACMPDPS